MGKKLRHGCWLSADELKEQKPNWLCPKCSPFEPIDKKDEAECKIRLCAYHAFFERGVKTPTKYWDTDFQSDAEDEEETTKDQGDQRSLKLVQRTSVKPKYRRRFSVRSSETETKKRK